MYTKFYELLKENLEKQGTRRNFSKELFLYSIEENPFHTNIIRLLDYMEKTEFCEIANFSLNNNFINRRSLFFLKIKSFWMKTPDFQRFILNQFINPKNSGLNRIIIQNDLFESRKTIRTVFWKNIHFVKVKIRNIFYNMFAKSPGWAKRLLRLIWRFM